MAIFSFALSARAQAPAHSGVSQAAQTAQTPAESQQQGTGIVPPGVKLQSQMPPAGPPRPFEFPNAATKTLSNGLRVFVVTDHDVPAVAVRLVIVGAGTTADPPDMPGVASMTANMLTQGTTTRSARDIAEAIDFVGGSLGAAAGPDSTEVGLSIMRKDLALGMDLMSDVVLHPAFQTEELERQRQQLLSALAVNYSDPNYLATSVFRRVVYANSSAAAYGAPGEGTPESVRKLDSDLLTRFHGALAGVPLPPAKPQGGIFGHYYPERSLLAFAGDITPAQAFAVAEKYFGAEKWPKPRAMIVEVPMTPVGSPNAGTPGPTPNHIWLIDKPDAVQTQIRVGKLGIRRADPDYIPLLVNNRVFGGGYNSRLNVEVRVKHGLTYGASSAFDAHMNGGAFVVSTFSRTEKTVDALNLILQLIQRISTGDITQPELDFARDYLAGVYPIQSETADQVAARVLAAAAFGLPADYNRTYPGQVRAVSLPEANEMAKKYFAPQGLDIVLAGNVSAFRDALKKALPQAEYHEIRFDELDLTAPGLARKSAQR